MKKTIIISASIIGVLVLGYFGYKWYKNSKKPTDVSPQIEPKPKPKPWIDKPTQQNAGAITVL